MRWLVLVVLAGCYAPSPYTSCLVDCAANGDCPTGQACFAGRCSERAGQCTIDASTIDANDPKGDIDDDGIPNAEDKCPSVPSPGNRDHDNDGTGDPCDPCPHLREPADDEDADGDLVGDGCDPAPLTPGESRRAFYGFYEATEIAGWTPIGSFTVSPTTETLVADNVALGGAFIQLPHTETARLMLTTGVTIRLVNSDQAVDHHVGISTHRDGSGFFHACQLHRASGVDAVRHVIYAGALDAFTAAYNGTFVAKHQLEMSQGDQTVCDVDGQPAMRVHDSIAGRVGLDASFVRADFDYLFIVELL